MGPSRSRNRPALLLLLALSLGWAQGAGPARGQPDAAQRAIKEGVSLHNGHRYKEAIARFQAAYQHDASLTKTFLLIGAAYLNLGRPQEMLEHYERYQQVETNPRPADRQLLTSYFAEAAGKLLLDHRGHPERSDLLLFAGRSRFDQGQTEEALSLYERYQGERARGDDLHEARLRGYFEDLRQRLEEEDRADPDRAERVLLLSRVYHDLGREDEAQRLVRRYRQLRAAALGPASPLPTVPPPRPAPTGLLPVPAPRPVRHLPRPAWRLATGAAAMFVGLGVAGLGVSALAVNNTCVQQPVPASGCQTDFDTLGIGSGLLGSGLALAIGGAVLIAVPDFSRIRRGARH